MQRQTFRTTANIENVRGAITAALHTALQGTAPLAGMMADGTPGSVWMVWPELKERESGYRGGFYLLMGFIRGELHQPEEDDPSRTTVLFEGPIIFFDLRYFGDLAPLSATIVQVHEAAAGLYEHLVTELGQLLPVAATVDQAPPKKEALQLEAPSKTPGAAADLDDLAARFSELDRGSDAYWECVRHEVLAYWARHGRRSLTMAQLAKLINYSISYIYAKASLGEKDQTL